MAKRVAQPNEMPETRNEEAQQWICHRSAFVTSARLFEVAGVMNIAEN
jgi:hypothetical protein